LSTVEIDFVQVFCKDLMDIDNDLIKISDLKVTLTHRHHNEEKDSMITVKTIGA